MADEKMFILVVDPEDSERDLVSKVLRSEGYEVVEVKTWRDASRVVDSSEVDLVLFEFRYAKSEGMEPLRYLRSATHLPMVAYAAEFTRADRTLATEAGCALCLDKPFSLRVLREVISALVKEGRPARKSC